MLVATELMRRGIDVAYPESDYGVDIIAFRRSHDGKIANTFVPIQVKARSASGYSFQKSWFSKAVNIVLVQVWWISETPEFYVFQNLQHVEDALGDHALSPSWTDKGSYSVTEATKRHDDRMKRHLDKWERIIDQLPPEKH
jgi:hypothetical protein